MTQEDMARIEQMDNQNFQILMNEIGAKFGSEFNDKLRAAYSSLVCDNKDLDPEIEMIALSLRYNLIESTAFDTSESEPLASRVSGEINYRNYPLTQHLIGVVCDEV